MGIKNDTEEMGIPVSEMPKFPKFRAPHFDRGSVREKIVSLNTLKISIYFFAG